MDELHDAIQDAQYIGAVTNAQRGPSTAFYNPTHTELSQFVERQERTVSLDWLSLESILDQPLGFYFFRRFCEAEQHGVQKLHFLVEVTKYRGITISEQRTTKAREIFDRFCCTTTVDFSKNNPTASDGNSSATAGMSGASVEPMPPSSTQHDASKDSGDGLVGAAISPRHSLVNLKEINVAAITTSGVIFWRKGEPTMTRADVADMFKECASETSAIGVGGEAVKRIAALLKRKAPTSPTNRTTSSASTASPRSSNADTSIASPTATEDRPPSVTGTLTSCKDDAGSTKAGIPPSTVFDEVEACVLSSLEQIHLKDFRASVFHRRLLAFLYLQTRKVVEDDFTVLRVLGRGGFGMVNGCIKRTSASLYAMKVMNKKVIKKKHAEKLCIAERKILAMISSPFLVCLKYAFQTQEELFLVLDLRTGGDLSYHLNRCRFTESQVRFWAAQILLGLQHLHEKNIVYRDLKPENILLDEKGNCSISDLGLAVEVTPNLAGRCGTRGYWAPEMLLRDENGQRMVYNHAVDWWSYGCIVYELLYGKCPFRTSKAKALHEDKQQAYDKATLELTPSYDPKYFSPEATELIQQLLIRDPKKRLGANGAEEVKRMKFFEPIDWAAVESMTMQPPFVPDNEINAASQADIGSFDISTVKGVKLSEGDQALYGSWDFVCPDTFQREAIEYLEWEVKHGPCTISPNTKQCCALL